MRASWAAVCLLGACACSSGDGGTANGVLRGSGTEAGAKSPGDGSNADVASGGGRASYDDSGVGTGGGSGPLEGPNGCGVGGAIGYALRIPEMQVSLGTDWTKVAGGSVSACLNDVCAEFGIPGGSAPQSLATLSPSSSTSPPNAGVVVSLHDEAPELLVTADWSLYGRANSDADIYSIVVTNFEHQVVATDRERATYYVPPVCPCTGPCGSATLTELSPESDAGAHDASADHDF